MDITDVKAHLLVVDDEEIICSLFKRVFPAKGYHVEAVCDGNQAFDKVSAQPFNLIVTDLKMPQVTGMDLLRRIKELNPYIEVIIMTGYATIESAVEAVKIGAFDFICKPFDIEQMQLTIEKCLEHQKRDTDKVSVKELTTLFEMSRLSGHRGSVDELFRQICSAAVRLTGAQGGSIDLGGRHVDIGGEAEVPERIDVELACVSEQANQGAAGMLSVAGKKEGQRFSDRDKMLLSVVAGQAAATLDNLRLYNQLKEEVVKLESAIEQLHSTQDRLIQSEKMSAVGQLAFGIAHEIRNPLGIILGGVDFLRLRITDDEQSIGESIKKMKQAIERANTIILGLLQFSRTSQLKRQPLPLQQILDDVVALVRNQACINKITVKQEYSSLDVHISVDPTLIKQVFFNLCMNAIDAMPAGGELSLRAQLSGLEEVVIEVADTGTGIAPKVLPRIFDPFFTTKEPGKGTGLGLSIVHLIIERHCGRINAESLAGQGTRFFVRLPLNEGNGPQNTEVEHGEDKGPAHRR